MYMQNAQLKWIKPNNQQTSINNESFFMIKI